MTPPEIIQEIRWRLGYSRRQLAANLGLSSMQIIYCYERGQRNPSLQVAYKLIHLAEKANMKITINDLKPEL